MEDDPYLRFVDPSKHGSKAVKGSRKLGKTVAPYTYGLTTSEAAKIKPAASAKSLQQQQQQQQQQHHRNADPAMVALAHAKQRLRNEEGYHKQRKEDQTEEAVSTSPVMLGPTFQMWRAVRDHTSGGVYYYHTATMETTWEPPPGYVEAFEGRWSPHRRQVASADDSAATLTDSNGQVVRF